MLLSLYLTHKCYCYRYLTLHIQFFALHSLTQNILSTVFLFFLSQNIHSSLSKSPLCKVYCSYCSTDSGCIKDKSFSPLFIIRALRSFDLCLFQTQIILSGISAYQQNWRFFSVCMQWRIICTSARPFHCKEESFWNAGLARSHFCQGQRSQRKQIFLKKKLQKYLMVNSILTSLERFLRCRNQKQMFGRKGTIS